MEVKVSVNDTLICFYRGICWYLKCKWKASNTNDHMINLAVSPGLLGGVTQNELGISLVSLPRSRYMPHILLWLNGRPKKPIKGFIWNLA